MSTYHNTCKLLLGLAVSCVSLWLAFRGIEWRMLGQTLLSVDLKFVAVGMICTQLEMYAAAWRWREIVKPLGRFAIMKDCFHPFMIGILFNQILPVRPGEVVRSYLFARKKGIPFAGVMATAVIEKLLDVVVLLLIMVAVAGFMAVPRDIFLVGLVVGTIAILCFIILWVMLYRHRLYEISIEARWWIPSFMSNKITGVIAAAMKGIGLMSDFMGFMRAFLLSHLVWIVGILVTQCYLWAFGLSLPWYAAAFVLVVVNIGSMLPSSPGAVGIAHFLYVISLLVFTVDRATGLAVGIVIHGTILLQCVAVGMLSLWKENEAFGVWKEAQATSQNGAMHE